MAETDQTYLWVHEAQERLGIGESLVRKLFDSGRLEGFRTPGSGHRRITAESVERMRIEIHGEGEA